MSENGAIRSLLTTSWVSKLNHSRENLTVYHLPSKQFTDYTSPFGFERVGTRRVVANPGTGLLIHVKTMSTKPSAALDADETAQQRAQAEQFAFDLNASGLVEVTNESHENLAEHQYTGSIDDVTEELMACTCPHLVHRNAFCKHMAAGETATDDGTLALFLLKDNQDGFKPADCDTLDTFCY